MKSLMFRVGIAWLPLFLVLQFSSVLSFLVDPNNRSKGKSARFYLSAFQGDKGEADRVNPSFSELGIHPSILNTIWSRSDWEIPTPVQQLAIPRLLDQGTTDAFWCEAPTGSGKTAAYLIPLLQNLLISRTNKRRGERVSALILCPTRELCVQIGGVLDELVNDILSMDTRQEYDLSTMVLHGGVPLEPQIARLADCVLSHTTIDILIATPGRLIDVLTSYHNDGRNLNARDAAMERRLLAAVDNSSDGDVSLEELQKLGLDRIGGDGDKSNDGSDGRGQLINMLHGLQYLILDESDRLLGKGFKGELDDLLDLLSSPPSFWAFSATFPKSIEPRLDNILSTIGSTNSPVRLVCANADRIASEDVPMSSSLKKKLDQSSTIAAASKYQQIGPASTIQLRNIRLEKTARTQALRKLLENDYKDEWDRVLVFVATRYASEHVSRKLRRYGIRSSELHGKLDQNARLRRLNDLKNGRIRVLLCTDVASRGIDISGLVRN
jgi:superfamily II DNA/RNA helicase